MARPSLLPRTLDGWTPWVVRATWALLAVASGGPAGEALSAASRPVQLVASGGLWLGWTAGVVASFIPHPVSLTALRLLAPAAVGTVLAAAAAGHADALAVGWAVMVTAWVFTPAWGAGCVNGPAYPNERRYLLRVPGPLLSGPLLIAWALMVAGAAGGPLLLAARQWVWGGLALAAGVPLAVVLARAVHGLSRRWIVFVPAGMVVHDLMTLAEPVLVKRSTVSRLGPAPAGAESSAVDLTQRALGLVLQGELDVDLPLNLVRPGRREAEVVTARKFLFSPTRPGQLLAYAKARRFTVG